MLNLFNQRDINIITDDLKIFLSAVKGPIDKLDYFTVLQQKTAQPGNRELSYQNALVDIIPDVENAVIQQMELAEKKELSVQLHLSPASFFIKADRLFLQQILFRLLSGLLEASEKRSVISVYVTDSDGKCVIEAVDHKEIKKIIPVADDYFKKHRITNAFQTTGSQPETILNVYKKMVEDMGGELTYSFKEKANYFRLKFMLA